MGLKREAPHFNEGLWLKIITSFQFHPSVHPCYCLVPIRFTIRCCPWSAASSRRVVVLNSLSRNINKRSFWHQAMIEVKINDHKSVLFLLHQQFGEFPRFKLNCDYKPKLLNLIIAVILNEERVEGRRSLKLQHLID